MTWKNNVFKKSRCSLHLVIEFWNRCVWLQTPTHLTCIVASNPANEYDFRPFFMLCIFPNGDRSSEQWIHYFLIVRLSHISIWISGFTHILIDHVVHALWRLKNASVRFKILKDTEKSVISFPLLRVNFFFIQFVSHFVLFFWSRLAFVSSLTNNSSLLSEWYNIHWNTFRWVLIIRYLFVERWTLKHFNSIHSSSQSASNQIINL